MTIVECHSGAVYAERPTALTWQGQRLEIEKTLSSWRSPARHYFRVQTAAGWLFELAWDEDADEWFIKRI